MQGSIVDWGQAEWSLGGFDDPAAADGVEMTRAQIADPDVVAKLRFDAAGQIRPCTRCNQTCQVRDARNPIVTCVGEPTSGRETEDPDWYEPATAPRRVVVVGGGPAGLEAARVCAERGHEVVVFEASSEAGGQIQLAARSKRRKELVGIAEWRVARCEALGVQMRFNTFADASDVLAESPDIVLVATGGLPDSSILEAGEELVVTSWDILSGDAKPGEEVLLYDDNGAHPGMQAAELIAESGAKLEIISPERFFAPEIGGLNHVAYARCFHDHGVRITINTRVLSVERQGNKLAAVLGSDYTDISETRVVDQVVVEHGTVPLCDLYFELKERSKNRGEVDYQALIAGKAQQLNNNSEGSYRLYRIGDAVSSRNIHAAIYDALRLCKDL